MPRRCHGIRGDVGIAPYGTTIDRQCVGADAHIRPSLPPALRATSLAEGGFGRPPHRGRQDGTGSGAE